MLLLQVTLISFELHRASSEFPWKRGNSNSFNVLQLYLPRDKKPDCKRITLHLKVGGLHG